MMAGRSIEPEEIPLSLFDLDAVQHAARTRQAAFGGPLRRQRRGVIGEHAVELFLASKLPGLAVRSIADEASFRPDIEVVRAGRRLELEVKTTHYSYWRTNGRIVGRTQWNQTTAAAYVWCLCARDPQPDSSILVMGWVPTRQMTLENIPRVYGRMQTTVGPAIMGPPELPSYTYDHDDIGYDDYENHRYDVGLPEDSDEDLEAHRNIDITGSEEVRILPAEPAYGPALVRHGLSDTEALTRLRGTGWREGSAGLPLKFDSDQARVTRGMNPPNDLANWIKGCLEDHHN